MDEDLKRLLEQMRQENAAAHQETRRHSETLVSELRRENAQAHLETRQLVDGVRQDVDGVRQDVGVVRQENVLAHQETRQYTEALVDGVRHEVDGVRHEVDGVRHEVDGVRREVDGVRQEVDGLWQGVDSVRQEVDRLRQENESAHVVTRRHFDVNVERMDHRFDALAEAFLMLDEKVDRRLTHVEAELGRTASDTQAMIKFSHSELDRRIRTLEETVADLK